jgi:DNA-binding MarR family transcriptional regulator
MAKKTMNTASLELGAESERRLPPLLRRSWYRLNQTFRRRIALLDLTPDQYTILRWLTEHSAGLTQKDLAGLMASDPNTITATLNRMQESGMVARATNANDKRANIVTIRSEGRAAYEQARTVAVELEAEVLNGIPLQQRQTFLRNLGRLAEACDAAYENTRQPAGDGPAKSDAPDPKRKGARRIATEV